MGNAVAGVSVEPDRASWVELWSDFEGRAARLERPSATAADAIDETIGWQLRGTEPFVKGAIPAARLHIPELYSGSPWKHCDRWMAYITTNPSIDSKEVFPTRADLVANGYEATAKFFQQRFDPGRRECPVVHGRTRLRPTRWVDRESPRPRGQATWSRAEEALRLCLGPQRGALPAPLGHISAIVDAVPWKFAKWSAVPDELKAALVQEGRRHFESTLMARTPAVIVATGEHVRRMMRTLYPAGIPEYEVGPPQSGTLAIGSKRIPWFGVVAPTGGKGRRFYDEMLQIAPNIRTALGIQV